MLGSSSSASKGSSVESIEQWNPNSNINDIKKEYECRYLRNVIDSRKDNID